MIPILKNIELICHSSFSHPFNKWPFFYYKRAATATHSFKFTVFFQDRRICSKEIKLVINCDTSLVLGIQKLRDSLLLDDIRCSNPCLLSVIMSWEYLKRYIMLRAMCLFHNTYSKHPFIEGGLWLIRENLKGTVFV